jgi:alpha-beta hydrolase superfamily lysophospholipase
LSLPFREEIAVSDIKLNATDGQSLHVYRWLPENGARAVVQIIHGVAEHAGRYAELAERLIARGFAVYAQDLRGHGRSVPDPEHYGFFAEQNGWTQVLADVRLVNAHLRQAHPGVSVVMIGHSMGSFIAQDYALGHREDIDLLVLSGPARHRGPLIRIGRALAAAVCRWRGARHRSRLINLLMIDAFRFSVRGRRTAFDWLTRDAERVDAFIADPACGFATTVSLWRDVTEALVRIGEARQLARTPRRLPVLLLAGSRDPVGGMGSRVRALHEGYREAGVSDLTLRLYPGARHEPFNETNRDEVIADLLEWLERRVPAADGNA